MGVLRLKVFGVILWSRLRSSHRLANAAIFCRDESGDDLDGVSQRRFLRVNAPTETRRTREGKNRVPHGTVPAHGRVAGNRHPAD